jgi:hypothetical protein
LPGDDSSQSIQDQNTDSIDHSSISSTPVPDITSNIQVLILRCVEKPSSSLLSHLTLTEAMPVLDFDAWTPSKINYQSCIKIRLFWILLQVMVF